MRNSDFGIKAGLGEGKAMSADSTAHEQPFAPCDPAMALCSDCDNARAKPACPRLQEKMAKRTE